MSSSLKPNPSPAFPGGGYFKKNVLIIFPLLILGAFFIIPVLSIFRHISFTGILESIKNDYYRNVISFTFLQAAVSTLAAVALGLPGAWIMSHINFRGRRLVSSITTVPFVLPSVLVVLGFVLCFGNSGILNSFIMKITSAEKPPLKILYSFKAIILAHTFYNFPIALRLISAAWRQIGNSRIEAAEILGAGRTRIFFTVILPSLLPSIIAAGSLIFIFCFMSFAVILVLGGGPAFSTLEVEIYRLARISLDIDSAASLALLGALLTALFTWIYIRLQKRASASIRAEKAHPLSKFSKLPARSRVFTIIYLLIILLLIIGPLAAVVYRSFQHRSGWSGNLAFTFKQYTDLFAGESSTAAIFTSVIIAFAAVLISLPAGFTAAYVIVRGRLTFSGLVETLFMLPMGVSAIVIGLGYYSLFTLLPEGFSNKGLLIVFAHSVIALPFVVRTFTTGIRAIKGSLIEASHTLGEGHLGTLLRVELPLLKGSIISAAAFAFCISAGEINAVLILSDGTTPTIPISIYRLISSYQFFGACAMGTVLMLICGIAFYLIDHYGGDEIF
ncbi:MAG: iron ABC transporter permease [Spirochaetales bacterium]|uniref:Iron ABC transporter permease n=1 Tax=Candidatus Thalassospirochaeta sargassi TaxID=3119039 RepID=A0AAJ1IFJ6_9SPIO|nr:iron ABC transporter permease [Spirochaetales bacterium]